MSSPTKFSVRLRPLVEAVGTTEAARICGVTPRSLQLWMRGPAEPCAAMQVGVLDLLERARRPRRNA